MADQFTYTFLILLLPFLSFLILALAGMKMSHKLAGTIGTISLGLVAVLSYYTAFTYFSLPRTAEGIYQTIIALDKTDWLPMTQNLHIGIGILLDPISVMMLIVISTVSFMVHIYSFGYMRGEKGFQRFYAYLSLFTMSMLGLVLATNIFQMYIFWEGVGICSYLLIGFYYPRHASVAASKKAFIVTRFADMFFLIGILFYSYYTQTFDFVQVGSPQATAAQAWLPLSLLLMFIGGAGKSAMFPLHIWLPDAMEGPTPVSALIHAATMVVAGVYLVARMFPLFIAYAPGILHFIAIVGAVTAFYAAVVACVQSDIKRVLAFSTISQIAFMMVSLGACTAMDPHEGGLGYMAAMFHLFTHAMFKGMLFLCAGCIIEIVGTNEKAHMGGLWKYMPITHITFLIACLAISGIPPFSGFFSKDEIIAACGQYSPYLKWWMSMVAGLTAFYMFRLYYVIFWGKSYYESQLALYKEGKLKDEPKKPHEESPVMTIPLIILAVITCFAGFIPFGHFISSNGHLYDIHIEMGVAVPSVIIALVGIGIATIWYFNGKERIPNMLADKFRSVHTWAYHRFYCDEVWMFITHKIIFKCICWPIRIFDHYVIDGFMNFLAWSTQAFSQTIRGFQSGNVQKYNIWYLSGALALTLLVIYWIC